MKIFFILTALFCCSSIAVAGGDCKVEGEAVVGVLDFEIEKCQIKGKLKREKGQLGGTFTVDLTKIDTGIELRNKHMRNKYLKTKKYPTAKLVLKPVNFGAKTFKGSFTLHGKTQLISGKVLEASKDKLEARFKIDITDYGIKKPGYKGIVIGQHLTVFATVR